MARSVENFVMIEGNVSWCELRATPTGKSVFDFGLVQNDSIPDGKGGFTERANFFTVTAWERMAENAAESVEKGTRVVVTGRLRYDEWEKDGVKNTKLSIVADTVSPALRWATASVDKNPKGGGGNGVRISDADLDAIIDA
jgi:single-strand DNA-binding protein